MTASDDARSAGRRAVLGPPPGRRGLVRTVVTVTDAMFFLLGAVAAGGLAVLTVQHLLRGGFGDWWLLLVLWILLAYLLLPRVHTALALVYVPDYFIGRARTYEGLLGDPVNVALDGTEAQIHEAMTRAGWHLADELGFRSGLRIITSTLSRRTYATAPVSPLFLFGRMQDFTYQQEVENSPARRHHVRFWRTPDDWFLPGGSRVDWLAAGTYDSGVGLSAFTLQLTHRVAQDTDLERDHIVRTVLEACPQVERTLLRHFSSGYHSRNGGGDAIATDGDLPVLDLGAVPAGDLHLPRPVHLGAGSLATQAKDLLQTARDTGASNRIKRPMTLYAGYGVMIARALVAVAAAAAVLIGLLPAGASVLGGALGSSPTGGILVVVAALLYVGIGQATFAGRPAARLLALTLSVAGITGGLLTGPITWTTVVSRLQFIDLVLDIAILITLSAGDVRDFSSRAAEQRCARPVASGAGPRAVGSRAGWPDRPSDAG